MIKHSQTYRNNNLQYKMQQNVLRAKNRSLPPYIIKFAHVLLMGLVYCYLKENLIAPDQRNFAIIHEFGVFADMQCERKLTTVLSDLLAADVEYPFVP